MMFKKSYNETDRKLILIDFGGFEIREYRTKNYY